MTPPCSYSSVAFSAPELAVGDTCSIMVGEESTVLTLSETATQIGTSSGMGGMGQPGGGMRPESGTQASDTGVSRDENVNNEESGAFSSQSKESGADRPDRGGEGMSGFGPEEITESENTESESSGFVSVADLDSNVWILLGTSCVILTAAIVFAVKYRK